MAASKPWRRRNTRAAPLAAPRKTAKVKLGAPVRKVRSVGLLHPFASLEKWLTSGLAPDLLNRAVQILASLGSENEIPRMALAGRYLIGDQSSRGLDILGTQTDVELALSNLVHAIRGTAGFTAPHAKQCPQSGKEFAEHLRQPAVDYAPVHPRLWPFLHPASGFSVDVYTECDKVLRGFGTRLGSDLIFLCPGDPRIQGVVVPRHPGGQIGATTFRTDFVSFRTDYIRLSSTTAFADRIRRLEGYNPSARGWPASVSF